MVVVVSSTGGAPGNLMRKQSSPKCMLSRASSTRVITIRVIVGAAAVGTTVIAAAIDICNMNAVAIVN